MRVELARIDGGVEHSAADLGENVALGAAYTLTPPSYGPTNDPGDKTQLTDGVYAKSTTWIYPETVGWRMSNAQFVRIDLGENLPIAGVAFRTSAGVAGVSWPRRILISVSEDGESWYGAGDLLKMSGEREPLPPYGTYSARQIWTDQLQTHGRYVGLVIEPEGPYTFCDEIEVYRGDASSGPYDKIADVLAPTTEYTDWNVASGSTYYYVVLAADTSFNKSGYSGEVEATAQARQVQVTFNATLPDTTPTGEDIYIGGNFNGWDPAGALMTRTGFFATVTLAFYEGDQLEYKYTRGSWTYVEKGAACEEISNRTATIVYGTDGKMTLEGTVLNWRNTTPCGE